MLTMRRPWRKSGLFYVMLFLLFIEFSRQCSELSLSLIDFVNLLFNVFYEGIGFGVFSNPYFIVFIVFQLEGGIINYVRQVNNEGLETGLSPNPNTLAPSRRSHSHNQDPLKPV